MGYLTNLLLVSAGLLLVSGSPAPAPKGYLFGTKANKEGYSRRRDDLKGNDYADKGEDYFFDQWIRDLAQPVIDDAFNTAIHRVENSLPSMIERNLPKAFDQGMKLALERVEKDLPNLIERALPVLKNYLKKGIQHASE